MWIFTPTAFVSIVSHRTKPGMLLVRARLKGDIERMFPGQMVRETGKADYRFRAEIPRGLVAKVVQQQLAFIDYENVKDAIPRRGKVHDLRHIAMTRVWGVMHDAQVEQLFQRSLSPEGSDEGEGGLS